MPHDAERSHRLAHQRARMEDARQLDALIDAVLMNLTPPDEPLPSEVLPLLDVVRLLASLRPPVSDFGAR